MSETQREHLQAYWDRRAATFAPERVGERGWEREVRALAAADAPAVDQFLDNPRSTAPVGGAEERAVVNAETKSPSGTEGAASDFSDFWERAFDEGKRRFVEAAALDDEGFGAWVSKRFPDPKYHERMWHAREIARVLTEVEAAGEAGPTTEQRALVAREVKCCRDREW